MHEWVESAHLMTGPNRELAAVIYFASDGTQPLHTARTALRTPLLTWGRVVTRRKLARPPLMPSTLDGDDP
jgi:hypothetical protein